MKVHLGFEVEWDGQVPGEPYYLPIHHTIVTGMTDLSGKTTTVEALLRRYCEAGGRALVFLTKRGEKTFFGAREIPPFYRERHDWEYVRGLLEAAMKEKLKFETPWIIRACKSSGNIFEVREWIGKRLEEDRLARLEEERREKRKHKKLRDLDRNQYTLLAAYLDKILPQLATARETGRMTETLEIPEGLNVMDLRDWYNQEVFQMVIIRSCMEHILANENGIIVGLPEGWKMLPQGRNTPVKLYFEKYIREGATNRNFLIIDAQDLGGVDKTPLRQVSLWVMGKMMQADEVERLLKQTLGLKMPAEEIQTLPLGHFIVANGVSNEVKKIYVWPWKTPDKLAVAVAKGLESPETIQQFISETRRIEVEKEAAKHLETISSKILERIETIEERVTALEESAGQSLKDDMKTVSFMSSIQGEVESLAKKLDGLSNLVADHIKAAELFREDFEKRLSKKDTAAKGLPREEMEQLKKEVAALTETMEAADKWIKQNRHAIDELREKAPTRPVEAALKRHKIKVNVEDEVLRPVFSTSDNKGKVLWLASNRFLDDWRSQTEIENRLNEEGWTVPRISLYRALKDLVNEGYLGIEKGRGKRSPNRFKLARNVVFE